MLHIIPALASADPLRLQEEIQRLPEHCPLHLDIEDGNFIPNITFGMKTVQAVAMANPRRKLDAHLIVNRPCQYLTALRDCGVSAVCAHIEALPYPMEFLRQAQSLGMRRGLALNIKTRPEELLPFVEDLDYVLLMTAEADFGSQTFFSYAFARVAEVRKLLPREKELWADGGIREEYLPNLGGYGMTTAIMGRSIFDSPDPAAAIQRLEGTAPRKRIMRKRDDGEPLPLCDL